MSLTQDSRPDNATTAAALILVLLLTPVLYRLYLHPLRYVPGPLLGRATSLFLYIICYLGIEGRVLRYYHEVYSTKVLRVSPNHVSISDSAAVREIYINRGGFLKDARYQNFNLGPVVSIFSAVDTRYRDVRAKAVAPLFAPARLRTASEPNGVIGTCVCEFTTQFQALKVNALVQPPGVVKADILDLSARLSIDVVTGYLLGERYGGLHEHDTLSIGARQNTKLSANPFIFAIVAFARFSLLPNLLFRLAYAISSRLNASVELIKAVTRLDKFASQIVKAAMAEPSGAVNTYQGRLLQAGISPAEAAAQSQAIIFAGADSTAVMLASILFHLVQNRDARARLLQEICSQTKDATVDLQALPYLRGVIKEGLRLGMANPTRFTRVVPAGGLRVGDIHLPSGTIVGCAPYILHHDPEMFPDPFSFRPERWLEDGKDNGLGRLDMERCMMPFGVGLRGCIGKNLAQQQIYESVVAVVHSGVLEGARTCQERIEIAEWFNGEIKDHKLEIDWSAEL
ncbi:hypothetical protein MMC17_009504 [Xylographa soralifera]|nr:hypothetical protein [Xylographa soralifera]